MSEPTVSRPTTPEQTASHEGLEAPPSGATPEQQSDWQKLLDTVPVEHLRHHPRFMGVLGSELESRRRAWEEDHQSRLTEQERQRLEAELEQQAKDDPDAFADRWLKDQQSRRQQGQLQEVHASARTRFAHQVGSALRSLPEWQELTEADHEDFFKALANKTEDEVLPTFTAKATERLSQVKAKKLLAEWQTGERDKERKAMRQEIEAELLTQRERPDVSRARGNGAISDEPDWRTQPREWDAWYARAHGGRYPTR